MLSTIPALCRESLISLAYFLCEKNGLEQIVWPRTPRGDPVTLTCVCVCVSVCLCLTEVGRDWTIVTRDLRTLIYLHVLNLEPREECSRTLGPGMQCAIGSSSRSGRNRASSSSSGRNRGAAVEAHAIGRLAAVEAGSTLFTAFHAR